MSVLGISILTQLLLVEAGKEKKKGSGAFRATASGILTVGSVCMRSNERRQLSLPELVDPPTQLLLPQQGFWRVVALEIPTEGRVNLGLVCVGGGVWTDPHTALGFTTLARLLLLLLRVCQPPCESEGILRNKQGRKKNTAPSTGFLHHYGKKNGAVAAASRLSTQVAHVRALKGEPTT